MVTIVVPLDGSKLAEMVLPYVQNLASRLHAEVYFVQAIEFGTEVATPIELGGATILSQEQMEREKRAAEDYLSTLAASWQSQDIDARWELLQGAPAASIVSFARSHKAYMIAMSTHGRSGLSRLVFGSVADQVMREAGIPVLLLRPTLKAG